MLWNFICRFFFCFICHFYYCRLKHRCRLRPKIPMEDCSPVSSDLRCGHIFDVAQAQRYKYDNRTQIGQIERINMILSRFFQSIVYKSSLFTIKIMIICVPFVAQATAKRCVHTIGLNPGVILNHMQYPVCFQIS